MIIIIKGRSIITENDTSNNSSTTYIQFNEQIPSALPPIFVQLRWRPRVSLTTPGLGAGNQTFVAGIYNLNNSTKLYVSIQISGTDQTGHIAFTTTSGSLRLLPQQTQANIPNTFAIQSSDVGLTFVCAAILLWRVDQTTMNMTSTQRGAGTPRSASLTLIPLELGTPSPDIPRLWP